MVRNAGICGVSTKTSSPCAFLVLQSRDPTLPWNRKRSPSSPQAPRGRGRCHQFSFCLLLPDTEAKSCVKWLIDGGFFLSNSSPHGTEALPWAVLMSIWFPPWTVGVLSICCLLWWSTEEMCWGQSVTERQSRSEERKIMGVQRPPAGSAMSQAWRKMLAQVEAEPRDRCVISVSSCCCSLLAISYLPAVASQWGTFSQHEVSALVDWFSFPCD